MKSRNSRGIVKTILSAVLMTTVIPGCAKGFSDAERRIIDGGEKTCMRVLRIDNPADARILREKSAPVSRKMLHENEFATLHKRLLTTVKNPENPGVGIAAPQVGILRRIIVVQRFDKENEPFECYVNPVITDVYGEKSSGKEGCLSVPDRYGEVERWQAIQLRYLDEQGKTCKERIEGFTAVIFQHEIDHLDGILYIDYLDAD